MVNNFLSSTTRPFLFSSLEIFIKKKSNILFISLSKAFNLKFIDDVSLCILLKNKNTFIDVIYKEWAYNPIIENVNIVIIE